MRYKAELFIIVLLSMVVFGNADAKLLIKVRPQPARIYQLAPPGVAVLTVTGLDEVTGEQMNVFRFSSSIDSSYFQIDSEGVMRTNRTVDRRVGTVFNFFIFGTLRGTIKYKYIEVIVSKENLYPPVFEREFYKVSAYRYLDNKVIVRVVAHDGDIEDYNRDFKYFIPDPPASDLFKINDYGEISLVKAPPDDMRSVSFHVFAINEGSPAKTRNTNVTVTFKDFQQADIYCFITGNDYIKLCWKNPMVGRNISGFIVKITGRRNRLDFVAVDVNTTEVCHVLEETQVGHYYRYKVNIQGAPDNDLELVLNITGVGFTSECLTSQFNPCNYLNPCNKGVCIGASDNALHYTCECPKGWRGKNCSEADMCIQNPCMNNGQCLYLGHQEYKCNCDENFIGKNCQHFNICTTYPCQNGGWCRNEDDGKFSCDCPDHFSGENCEVPDPCQPSPCGGQGLCTRISSTEFVCDCILGYSGKRCDEINRCLLDSPCMNSGTCLSTGNNTFTCSCTPQTTGRYCEQFNPCSQLPCMNNSTCKAMGNSRYLCQCLPGYHGGECQYYDPCRVKTCNNGTCTLTGIGTLQCICQDGFFGESCEYMDPCYDMPCGNGGMCRNISLTEYKCECFQEWFGENCENLKSCTLNLCRNNATCLNIPPSSYECICKSGYYGDLCGMYNACYDLPCNNGGECVNNTEGYLCKCLNGYGGQNCEYRNLCSGDPCNEGTCMTVSDSQFACNCSAGYTGELCNVRDYCYENLCKNGGECISTENDFICDCVNDHYGKLCHYLNYCKSEPCNNGTCHLEYKSDDVNNGGSEVEHQEGYTCTCFDGYTGSRCEHRVMDCSNIVCLHGGDCVDSICLCPEGYTGEVCEHVVSPCEPSPCQNNQYCQVSAGHRYVCKCRNGAVSPDCIKGCTAETTRDKTGQYHWPDTQIIDTAELSCPYGTKDRGNGQATRDCFKQNGKAIWDKPNTSMCAEMGIGDVNQHLDYLKTLTSDPSNMGPDDVTKVADELEKIYQFSLESKSVANNMVTVVSNLADVNMSVMAESNSKSQTSDRLLSILEDYTADVISDNVINLSTSNIDIRALDIVPDKIGNTSIRYEPQLGNKTTERGFSISLPPEIFQKGDRQIVRLQFLGFQKSTFFVPKDENELVMDNASSQRVVTATVKGRKLQNLKQMVSFKMPSIKANANHTCVYWDDVNKTWSSEGVITGTSGNMTECWSSHLTSFAILLDPSPEHALPVIHEQILTYITYIGCAISMVGLILTILTYTLFKCLHGEKSGKILLNLCVAMLLMNLAFLFGSQSSTAYGDDICTAVAVLLHLFLLATLMWMLVEAVEMYQALVTVFNKYARFYMMKRCVVGWGVPLLIVIITLSIDIGHYKPSTDFCFISQASPIAYYASLVGPACVILIVNTLVFILVARVILKPRFQQQERGTNTVTPAQIRGAFTVMILLGITWVFGPLAIHGAKLVFNYLFCILNSLQGFLIFVFRCLFNPEARLAWIQLIKTGTLKRRRGAVKSVYSESSSKVDTKSRSNGHSNGHSKSNIIQANGWQGNKLNNDCDDSPYLNGHNRRSTKCSNMDFNMENNMLSAKDSVTTEEEYIPDKDMTQRNEDNTHL